MKKNLFFLSIAFLLISNLASAQCSNCNENYPTGTLSTTSNTLVTVSNLSWGGDYSFYNVTIGETYEWTTCGDPDFDTQLTLTSGGCGGTVLAYNDDNCGLQSTIIWTATFTGTVTVLISQYNCQNYTGSFTTLQWRCVSCGTGGNGGTTCTHTIFLYDSYGDGWSDFSGNYSATVYVNGIPVLSNIALANGYGPQNFIFQAATNDLIQVTFSDNGWYGDECSYSIDDGDGNTPVNNYYPYYSGTWNGTGTCPFGLPVELVYFDADCDELMWQTATENNSDYFEVEVSLDLIKWENIARVEAAGNSTSINQYKLDYRSKYSMQYYRLVQFDLDGQFEIYGPISVECKDLDYGGYITGFYNLAGQFIGMEYPTHSGIYLIRYSTGEIQKVFVN